MKKELYNVYYTSKIDLNENLNYFSLLGLTHLNSLSAKEGKYDI